MLSFVTILVLAAPADPSIPTNRTWEILPKPTSDASRRHTLTDAATRLGNLTFDLGGMTINAALLRELAQEHPKEPLLRTCRELLRRPVDLDDFLRFLDDLLVAYAQGLNHPVVVPASRARSAGIFLHPYDVFRPERSRQYGQSQPRLPITAPTSQDGLQPAQDGEIVGPRWAARYQQPDSSRGRIRDLAEKNLHFAKRVKNLMRQLQNQGAYTEVEAAVRKRERGYLIYGSWWLSQATDAPMVDARLQTLRRLNQRWRLNVPIQWRHPDGWEATVEAARQLAETYSVDYATRKGARRSKHYDGKAVDFWAVDLPRTVKLTAPDGAHRTFDLSDPEHPRDLSLAPGLIDWIETHFAMRKLKTDYPHWNDARKTRRKRRQSP